MLRSSVRGPDVFFRGQCVEDALLRVAVCVGCCFGWAVLWAICRGVRRCGAGCFFRGQCIEDALPRASVCGLLFRLGGAADDML